MWRGWCTAPYSCYKLCQLLLNIMVLHQVLVAVGSTVILADADSATDQGLTVGPISRMAVAPNGQFLAGFTGEGKLVVWTADFGKFLSEFATQSDTPPEQLAWCGTDSVVLYWEVSHLFAIN